MKLIFVHGWSVTDTSTYGRFPEVLSEKALDFGLEIDIRHLWLGKYISFHDEVTMADIVRAFDTALHDVIPEGNSIAEFSCITHSTGGPVVREWLDRYYGSSDLSQAPLRHLIMLAPANHGSPLAALGKARVGRIKAWFSGIEPGQRILDWLSLGSQQQIDLASSFLDYKPANAGFYPFVLTGQTIDKKFYDFVNSYLVEAGSDGVVRTSGANLNYSMITLAETKVSEKVTHGVNDIKVHLLKPDGKVRRPVPVPFGVVPEASHSGAKKGIMRSVLSSKSKKKTQVDEVLKCLQVKNKKDYATRTKDLDAVTEKTQRSTHKYSGLVFVMKDDEGNPVEDFDLFLLGGASSDPNKLSKGFFVDRQRNKAHPNHLVYYVDYDVITENKLSGFRVIARPQDGFAFYHAVEYRSDGIDLNALLRPNETFYVQIILHRCVDQSVFTFDAAEDYKLRKEKVGLLRKKETRNDFKTVKPSGKEVDKV